MNAPLLQYTRDFLNWYIVYWDTNFTLGCDENGQPQEISPADFNSSCPYSGPPSDAKLATFYDFHEIKPGGEEIRYEPGTELLFRCVDIGK